MKARIENLGDPEFQNYPLAKVIAEYKSVYKVSKDGKEYLAKITGKKMFLAEKREDYPAVGDWVAIETLPGESAVIREVLPRKTVLKKQVSNGQELQVIAANIDIAFIVESVDRDYSLNRYERYLVLVREAGITPILVLNKIDLISEPELKGEIDSISARFTGIQVLTVSTLNENGLKDLESTIERGKTYCFLGSSGVGKSSIINKLLKVNMIRTKEISTSLNRGKHTTTTRELYVLENGGMVIDNPGIRSVGTANMDAGISEVFEEVTSLIKKCKYSNCTHTHEPGCMVKELIDKGELNKERYLNYIKLKKESEYYKMTDVERRAKNRSFGRFVKKSKSAKIHL